MVNFILYFNIFVMALLKANHAVFEKKSIRLILFYFIFPRHRCIIKHHITQQGTAPVNLQTLCGLQ